MSMTSTQVRPAEQTHNPIVPRDYLLVARCGMDDIPLRLFKREAYCRVESAARGVTLDHVMRIARDVFDLDASSIVCLSIVELSPEGEPARCETIEIVEGGQS